MVRARGATSCDCVAVRGTLQGIVSGSQRGYKGTLSENTQSGRADRAAPRSTGARGRAEGRTRARVVEGIQIQAYDVAA